MMLAYKPDIVQPAVTSDEIADTLCRAADAGLGYFTRTQTREWLLTIYFVKYLSDWWDERQQYYEVEYHADPARAVRVRRAMRYERFHVPEDAHFTFLYHNRHRSDIGILLSQALGALEQANPDKLAGAFWQVDFASGRQPASLRESNRHLQGLLETLQQVNLAPGSLGGTLAAGEVYETLLARFATETGRQLGEFFTPPAVADLLARLVAPQAGDRIGDPFCGSASLLLRTGRQVPGGGSFLLYGQELQPAVYALARQNCVLHEQDDAALQLGNTLMSPLLTGGGRLQRFNVVVSSPPMAGRWDPDQVSNDPYQRFHRGLPPRSSGDFAGISHVVETLAEADGRAALLVPLGVLFRGGAEGKIRQQLVEEGLVEAVIGLPARLFPGTGLATALLLLRRQRPTTDVLFVEASQFRTDESSAQAGQPPLGFDRIVAVVRHFQQVGASGAPGVLVPQLAYRASLAEVASHEFNLSLPRYVPQATAATQDLADLLHEAARLQAQVAEVRDRIQEHLADWNW